MYSHLTPVNSPSPVLWCGIVVTALTVWTTLKVWRQVVMETALRYRVWGRKQSFVSEPRTAWTATAQRAQLLCDIRANEPWQRDPLTQKLNGYNVLEIDTECNYVSLSANSLLVSIGISVDFGDHGHIVTRVLPRFIWNRKLVWSWQRIALVLGSFLKHPLQTLELSHARRKEKYRLFLPCKVFVTINATSYNALHTVSWVSHC